VANYAESLAARRAFLDRLAGLEDGATQEMLRAYGVALDRIEQDMLKALEADTPHGRAIAEAFDGAPDTHRISVIRGRAEAISNEFARMVPGGAQAVRALAPNAYRLGIDQAGDQIRTLNARFTRPNRRQVEQAVARLQRGTAAREYLHGFAITSTQQAVDTMTAGVILGERPDKIARRLRTHVETFGRARLQTFVHTEVLGAARAGIADSYRENSDILSGWVWNAEESAQTCEVCWAMNGTEHPLDEDLDSHPNCRCVQTPITKTWDELVGGDGMDAADVPETGARPFDPDERFNASLTDDEKIKVLGAGKYRLWRDGEIRLADLVTPTMSDRWGAGLRATTLRELRERGAGSGVGIIEQVAAGAARAERVAPDLAAAWRTEFDDLAEAFSRYDLPTNTSYRGWSELLDANQDGWSPDRNTPGIIPQAMETKITEIGQVIDSEVDRRVRALLGDDVMDAVREFDAVEREITTVTRQMSDAWKEYIHAERLYQRTANTRNRNRLDKAKADYDALTVRSGELLARRETVLRNDRDRVLKAQQQATRDVLAEIRDYGDGVAPSRDRIPDGFDEAIATGQRAYPTEWINNLPQYRWRRVRRGYHSEVDREIALSGDAIRMRDVAIHEFGHAMESTIPGIRLLEWAFYYRRTLPQSVKAHNIPGYSKKEWFREDDFGHFYVGKDYARYYGASDLPRPSESYEIVSMGVESLLGQRHSEVVWRDDDYRRFILGILAVL
jgi:SPP1 gp7 family putative phage head morphogenesis protein